MAKTIQVYAYIHTIEHGIVTLTAKDNDIRRVQLAISDVDLVFDKESPRKALVTIPEYLAIGKGLRRQDSTEQEIVKKMLPDDWNVSDDGVTAFPSGSGSQNVLLRNAVRREGDMLRREIAGFEL